ncbi:extracellular solute-binding protein [Ochrobactrum haematophilum]|uniref:Extracellular solute-binding protein n=1 Tax=Brucella haematophila TaxID=419474 RepID=A0ABX1DQ30_9HYPH|nr:extracellular solute-binding protein [Brucella haematophila]
MRRSSNHFTHAIKASLVALAAFALTGAASAEVAGDWNGIVAKAKEEGRVNYYSVMPPAQNDALITAFQKTYPEIKVVVVRGAGELAGRIAAEQQAGSDGADVFAFADTGWFATNKENLLDLKGPNVEAFPKAGWTVDGKSVNLSFSPLGFLVWNTARVKDGLKEWNDLLAPELKGHVGTREGMTSTLAGFLEFVHDRLGQDYFEAFGKQQPRFYPSTVPLTQAVASGEVWAANTGNVATIIQLVAQGAPIDFSVPKPSFANPQAGAVLGSSSVQTRHSCSWISPPHPKARRH